MTETTDPQAAPLTDRQLDEIEKMPRAQDIDLLIAEVRRLRAAPAAAPSAPADRAAILREAAERVTGHAADHFPDEYDDYADQLADELRRMAGEAQQPTPCSVPNVCEDGGDPCTTHEREHAHTEGDHGLCGAECHADRCTCDSEDHTHDGGCPLYEPDGEAQQPETQARPAAYQTCGVCKSGYPTGGSCGTCAFNARMAAGARQADTAGEQPAP